MRSSIVSLILCAMLTSCISHQQTTVAPSSTVNSAAMLAALNAIRNGKPVPLTKTVAENSVLKLDTAMDVNPDCSSAGMPTVRITQEPVHGKATIVHEDAFPGYVATNPRSACNKDRLPAIVTYYKPEKGFTGMDNLVMETINEGSDLVYNITITVK